MAARRSAARGSTPGTDHQVGQQRRPPPRRAGRRPPPAPGPVAGRGTAPGARSCQPPAAARFRAAAPPRVMARVFATRNAPTASATRPNRNASPAKPAWARPSWCSASASRLDHEWLRHARVQRCLDVRLAAVGDLQVDVAHRDRNLERLGQERSIHHHHRPRAQGPEPESPSSPTMWLCGTSGRRS